MAASVPPASRNSFAVILGVASCRIVTRKSGSVTRNCGCSGMVAKSGRARAVKTAGDRIRVYGLLRHRRQAFRLDFERPRARNGQRSSPRNASSGTARLMRHLTMSEVSASTLAQSRIDR